MALDRGTFILRATLATLQEIARVKPRTQPHRQFSDYLTPRRTPVINAAYVTVLVMHVDLASPPVNHADEHDGTELLGLRDAFGEINRPTVQTSRGLSEMV